MLASDVDPNWAYVFIFFGLMSFVSTFLYFWPYEAYLIMKRIKRCFIK